MKKRFIVLTFFLAFVILSPVLSYAVDIGPGTLPSWQGKEQVKLGWRFSDPVNPQFTPPIAGWDKAIGSIPTWSYDPNRTAFGNPAQWYIKILNFNNDNPVKRFWISWVYEFDRLETGTRVSTQMSWTPFTGWADKGLVDEWFDQFGNPTGNHMNAEYGRITWEVEMYPNPEYEEVWLGLFNSLFYANEVYVMTVCVAACKCDIIQDSTCDMLDWIKFGEDWGRSDCLTPGVECECDLNTDGSCDMQDWIIFGNDWGRTDCP